MNAHEHGTPRSADDAETGDDRRPRPGELDLQPDVERLHRAIRREPRDPVEGREPTPRFMWAVIAVALFWGGWYLGRHGGEFGLATHVAFANHQRSMAPAAAPQMTTTIADPILAGKNVFTKNCQACHQQNGAGVPGVFPPIVGSDWVTGPAEIVVRILLNGLHEPITVAGATYNGAMPAWRDVLTDQEIAAVASYIRQWTPNASPPVEADFVSKLRAATATRTTPWTESELKANPPRGIAP
jgi:mono/diheme cytochrome c family protein